MRASGRSGAGRSGAGRSTAGKAIAVAAILAGMAVPQGTWAGSQTAEPATPGWLGQLIPGLSSEEAATRASAPPALSALVQSLGQRFNGRVGISITSVEDGWTVAYNGDQLMPQQSVSKLWVTMAMLDAVDRGKLDLSRQVTIRPEDLTLFHQPIAAMVKGAGYTTTLSDLMHRAMTQSDNTANDSILRTIGGPEAVRSYLARRFVDQVRFGPGERLLQAGTAGLTWSQDMAQGRRFYAARAALPLSARQKALDAYVANPVDGASASGISQALAKLKRGEMLSAASTQLLLSTMESAKTGPQRVKGGVPAGWRYGHKTGTGQELGSRQAGYNDVGIMTAPDGSSYAVAVLIGSTSVPIPERWALMQSVSRTVAAMHISHVANQRYAARGIGATVAN